MCSVFYATSTPTCRRVKTAVFTGYERRARDEHGSAPPPHGAPLIQGDPGAKSEVDPAIVCAACGHPITRPSARAAIGGAHVHTFKNPSGIDYTIGCFHEAHGCRSFGEPSFVWTWFPGHAWQLALCARCGEHLGWSFHGDAGVFWGLVLERLREAS